MTGRRRHQQLDLGTLEDRAWMRDAACRDLGPEMFYPLEESGRSTSYDEARAICAGCPVQRECAEHARLWNEQHGCWAGTSPRERRPKNGELREIGARCEWCSRTFTITLPMRRGWQNSVPRFCGDDCATKQRARERDEHSRYESGRKSLRDAELDSYAYGAELRRGAG